MEDEAKKEEKSEGNAAENAGQIDELEKCQKERDEYLDGWKRAKADLANYKKDELKHFEEFAKWSQESLIREVIVVLDSFDLALVSSDGDEKSKRGLQLIRNQLEDILRKNGLVKIAVSIGGKFNPAEHEAIGEIESDKPSGAIVEEVERGYGLNGKVVRAARVKIAK